jgi:aromatic-L-amino-acid decarboxylase
MGNYLRQRLRASGWKILNETPLPVICFSHPQIEAGVVAPEAIVAKLKAEQTAWISKTRLGHQIPALRACITNFQTQPHDVDCLVDGLVRVLH